MAAFGRWLASSALRMANSTGKASAWSGRSVCLLLSSQNIIHRRPNDSSSWLACFHSKTSSCSSSHHPPPPPRPPLFPFTTNSVLPGTNSLFSLIWTTAKINRICIPLDLVVAAAAVVEGLVLQTLLLIITIITTISCAPFYFS